MFNKIKVVEKVRAEKRKNMDVLLLKYEHTQGRFQGQQWDISALVVAIPKEAKTALLQAKPGDILWMEQATREGTDKDGNPRTYYSIGDIRTASPDQPAQAPTAKSTASKESGSSKSADDVGMKVGTARNQALEVLKLVGKKYSSADQVLAEQRLVSDKIILQQATQEADVRNGNLKHSATEELEDHSQDLEPNDDGPSFE